MGTGLISADWLKRHISNYADDRLARLLPEIRLSESAYRSGSNGENEVLLSAAKRYRIDPERIRRIVVR
jgi:hypothetical protein